MKKHEIALWVFAILIPITVMVIGLLLIPKKKNFPAPDSTLGPTIHPVQNITTTSCGSSAVHCDLNDPNSCSDCDGFVCTNVGSNDTDYDIEGTYCLPAKPISACTQVPTDPNYRMQGKLHWTGWSGVNVQAWDCSCPYPRYYPMDTSQGASLGACKRSPSLCRHGTWQYPCKRSPDGTCEQLSPSESAALVGSDPLMNGMCSCDNVPCTSHDDCAGNCVDGVCAGQRLSMNSSGIPECVVDTCGVSIACETTCPGSARCVGGVCQESTSVCSNDADCGPGGTCTTGKCRWGKWELHNTPPYVFGTCACPDGYVSSGTSCVK